jgi:uncharacterized membrane protein
MMMRKAITISIILIVIQFMVACYLYPMIPEKIAIHWNINGEADGYSSRLVGLFIIPTIEIVLVPLFLILPRIDPQASSEKLTQVYDWFILVFTFYMFYVFGLSIAWNLGYRFDFLRFLIPVLGILFYGIGDIMSRVEMNWFLGIRTPWTMSNQEVWDDTHHIGSRLFKASGLIALIGVFFSGWLTLGFAILPIMLSGFYVIVYSYIRYKELTKN